MPASERRCRLTLLLVVAAFLALAAPASAVPPPPPAGGPPGAASPPPPLVDPSPAPYDAGTKSKARKPPARLRSKRRSGRVTGGAAQGPNYWDSSQAWFRCVNLYSPTTQTLNLRWHTYNGSVRWIYWRVWMQTSWNDPAIKGIYWKSPGGWYPRPSPLWGPNRMNGFGIVELQQNQGGSFSNDPWYWDDEVLLGYNMYARAWAELWVWNGSSWNYGVGVVRPDISTADAPGWCFNT